MLRAALKSVVPLWLRRLRHHRPKYDYREAYEEQARNNTAAEVIGDGDYDAIGRIQLELLVREGLQPNHTLIDFGCGNGRLATHAIPYLSSGQYVGIDHCNTFLARAKAKLGTGKAQWHLQTSFEFPKLAADMVCAFSVFTHMEHEDAFRYLQAARLATKVGGRMVFSCLPLDQKLSQGLFLQEANDSLAARWSRVRNVVTSKELMTQIAILAGWRVDSWTDGDARSFRDGTSFGQSACMLTNV